MRWRCFGYEWWQVAGFAFIILFGIPYLLDVARDLVTAGEPEPRFSSEESELRRKLEPFLHSLPLAVADDDELLGGFYDCSEWDGPIETGVNYYLDRRGDELQGVEVVDHQFERIANTSLCDGNSRAKITSVAHLAPKEHLVADMRIYHQLTRGDDEDLRKLVEADVDKYFPGQESYDYHWLDARRLGEAAYGFAYTVMDEGEPFNVHEIFFIREVVYAGMSVTVPDDELSSREALSLAAIFDDKIASQVDLISAQIEAR